MSKPLEDALTTAIGEDASGSEEALEGIFARLSTDELGKIDAWIFHQIIQLAKDESIDHKARFTILKGTKDMIEKEQKRREAQNVKFPGRFVDTIREAVGKEFAIPSKLVPLAEEEGVA